MEPIILSRKPVKSQHIDASGMTWDIDVEEGYDYDIDAYVDHRDLKETISKRCAEKWDCFKIIECKPTSTGDIVTLFWRK